MRATYRRALLRGTSWSYIPKNGMHNLKAASSWAHAPFDTMRSAIRMDLYLANELKLDFFGVIAS